MKYARLIDGVAVDVVLEHPTALFIAEIAAQFAEVPDHIEHGWMRDEAGVWAEPHPEPVEVVSVRPELKITAVAPDAAHAASAWIAPDHGEATCPTGTVLTVTAELRDPAGNVLPLDDHFRMPIVQRGGRTGMLLASMTAGIVTVIARFDTPGDDGVWLVDEATINAGLPSEAQMSFAGFKVNVYRS